MIHEDFKSDDNSLNVNYEDFNFHVTRQSWKWDHKFKRCMLQKIINVKLNRMNNETEHDAVIKTFCSYFQRIEMRKILNMKDQEFFQRIEIELSVNILEHDVSAVVCMLINFNTTMLKKIQRRSYYHSESHKSRERRNLYCYDLQQRFDAYVQW